MVLKREDLLVMKNFTIRMEFVHSVTLEGPNLNRNTMQKGT